MATDLSRQIVGRRACFPCERPDGSVWIAFTEIEAKYATGAISRTEALRQLAYAKFVTRFTYVHEDGVDKGHSNLRRTGNDAGIRYDA